MRRQTLRQSVVNSEPLSPTQSKLKKKPRSRPADEESETKSNALDYEVKSNL